MTCAAILSLYPKAQIETALNFMGGVLSSVDFEPPEQKLSALSAKLATDVIWVSYQSTAGSFIFHHWHNGLHLRALAYGCVKEGHWDRVEGQVESWEKDCFWDDESLAMMLEVTKSDGERRKLQKLWNDGVLINGEAWESTQAPFMGRLH